MKKEYLPVLIFSLLLLSVNTGLVAQENKNAEDVPGLYSYSSVEISASFPGGPSAMYKFILAEFKMPSKAMKKKIKGNVFVRFTVEKDGSLSEINVLKDLGYGIIDELIRVLQLSPKWIPASANGIPVRGLCQIPIIIDSTNKNSIIRGF